MVPHNLPLKRLRQPRPIPRLDEKRNRGLAYGYRELGELLGRDLLQPWSSQHEIEIAAVVASPVDTAPVGPDLDVWQVIAEQGFESAPML